MEHLTSDLGCVLSDLCGLVQHGTVQHNDHARPWPVFGRDQHIDGLQCGFNHSSADHHRFLGGPIRPAKSFQQPVGLFRAGVFRICSGAGFQDTAGHTLADGNRWRWIRSGYKNDRRVVPTAKNGDRPGYLCGLG